MSQQKKIKALYREVHLFNMELVDRATLLQDNIYKADDCDVIIDANIAFREEFKKIMNRRVTRGFENLLFTVLNDNRVYNITLYRNFAIQSLVWSKKSMIDFFDNELSDRIVNGGEKEKLLLEYNRVVSSISQLENDSYRVHRHTGKTVRANIKDEKYHDIVERITINAKSGLVLPIDADIKIEENRPRKARTDKLETLCRLVFDDKTLYLMKK